jgi:hypothetical protein
VSIALTETRDHKEREREREEREEREEGRRDEVAVCVREKGGRGCVCVWGAIDKNVDRAVGERERVDKIMGRALESEKERVCVCGD